MLIHKTPLIGLLALGSCLSMHAQDSTAAQMKAAQLRAALAEAPALPLKREEVAIHLPSPDAVLGGRIVSIATDRKGELTYVLVRADKDHQPVLVLDRQGHIVRSFGKGLISVAHNIKIDSQGNVWTTNAGNSKVIKFSPDGKELMEFVLGDSPTVASGGCAYLANPSNGYMDFCGTTDIVVTPEGRIFVTDGYGKKRVLEYSAAGDKRIREWGGSGTEPGKFVLPHGLAYDGKGVLFVTDREGGRIERFDTKGTYIGEWTLGNAGSIAYARGALWAVIAVPAELQSGEKPKRSSFVIRIDPVTGKILGKLDTTGPGATSGTDFIDVNENGEVLAGVTPGGFVRYSPAH